MPATGPVSLDIVAPPQTPKHQLDSFVYGDVHSISVSTGRQDRAWELLLAIAGALSSGRPV